MGLSADSFLLAKGIASVTLSIISIPFKILSGFIELAAGLTMGPSPVVIALEEVRKQFGDLAENEGKALGSRVRSLRKDFRSLGLQGRSLSRLYGMGQAGVAAALKDLTALAKAAGPAFSGLKDQFEKNGAALLAFRKGLGLSDEGFGAFAKRARAYGQDITTELTNIGGHALQMQDKFGISSKLITRDVGEMMASVSDFGHLAPKTMIEVATYTRRLGMEVKSLSKMIDKMLNFEDAAQSAADLSAGLGMNVELMKIMTTENPAEVVETYRKALFRTGRTIEDLNMAERKLLETKTGIVGADAEAAFGAANRAKSYDEVAKAGKKAESVQHKQLKVLGRLAKAMERVIESQQKARKGFFDAFVSGFGEGVQMSNTFRSALYAVHKSIRIVEKFGRRLGIMFMNTFPGIKEMFQGIKDMFDPAYFRTMTASISGYFRTFFKEISGPKSEAEIGAAVNKVLTAVSKTLTDWLSVAGDAGAAMGNGLKVFSIMFAKVFGHIGNWLLGQLMDGFTVAFDGLALWLEKPGSFKQMTASLQIAGESAVGGMVDTLAGPAGAIAKTFNEKEPQLSVAFNRLMDVLNREPDGLFFKMKEGFFKVVGEIGDQMWGNFKQSVVIGLASWGIYSWFRGVGLTAMTSMSAGIVTGTPGAVAAWTGAMTLIRGLGGGVVGNFLFGSAAAGTAGLMTRMGTFLSANTLFLQGIGARMLSVIAWPFAQMAAAGRGMAMAFQRGMSGMGMGGFGSLPGAGSMAKWGAGAMAVGSFAHGVMNAIKYQEKAGEVGGKAKEFGATILSDMTFGLVDKDTWKSIGDTVGDFIIDNVFGSESAEEKFKEAGKKLIKQMDEDIKNGAAELRGTTVREAEHSFSKMARRMMVAEAAAAKAGDEKLVKSLKKRREEFHAGMVSAENKFSMEMTKISAERNDDIENDWTGLWEKDAIAFKRREEEASKALKKTTAFLKEQHGIEGDEALKKLVKTQVGQDITNMTTSAAEETLKKMKYGQKQEAVKIEKEVEKKLSKAEKRRNERVAKAEKFLQGTDVDALMQYTEVLRASRIILKNKGLVASAGAAAEAMTADAEGLVEKMIKVTIPLERARDVAVNVVAKRVRDIVNSVNTVVDTLNSVKGKNVNIALKNFSEAVGLYGAGAVPSISPLGDKVAINVTVTIKPEDIISATTPTSTTVNPGDKFPGKLVPKTSAPVGAGIGREVPDVVDIPSDSALKENVELVGTSPSGINVYEFDYKDKSYGEGRYRGVMAQEVPWASSRHESGDLWVNYSRVDVKFERIG